VAKQEPARESSVVESQVGLLVTTDHARKPKDAAPRRLTKRNRAREGQPPSAAVSPPPNWKSFCLGFGPLASTGVPPLPLAAAPTELRVAEGVDTDFE